MRSIETFFVNIGLQLYEWFNSFRLVFFRFFGQFMMIYYVDGPIVHNITHLYYLNRFLGPYQNGRYYLKIYNEYGTHHLAFNGTINTISNIQTIDDVSNHNPRRKKFIILDSERNPVDFDLRTLDNYYLNAQQFGDKAVDRMDEIFQLFGIKCSYVSIFTNRLFDRVNHLVTDIRLDDLYL